MNFEQKKLQENTRGFLLSFLYSSPTLHFLSSSPASVLLLHLRVRSFGFWKETDFGFGASSHTMLLLAILTVVAVVVQWRARACYFLLDGGANLW